jgi:hypothetical protein
MPLMALGRAGFFNEALIGRARDASEALGEHNDLIELALAYPFANLFRMHREPTRNVADCQPVWIAHWLPLHFGGSGRHA